MEVERNDWLEWDEDVGEGKVGDGEREVFVELW